MTEQHRIETHPILDVPKRREIAFTFNGKPFIAYEGEVITSALIAGGVTEFGRHAKDDGAQSIFCVNGQCSQCLVLADGIPVKGCMAQVSSGMKVESISGLPVLPPDDASVETKEIPVTEATALIIGGGPAGINAAIELGRAGVETLLIDDKHELGGKLTLQTHGFFGSVADCWAGTRGIDIAGILTDELEQHPSVEVWLNASAVALFEDKLVGVVKDGAYFHVAPEVLLVATGAREKNLAFPGCDLPGVYGAGAFQTLVNRDLVRSSERLFIVGGGNVGLIAGYHAIQAGIQVVGLVEALPKCGGYMVHEDKLKRLGVPIWTSHTVARVDGNDRVESVTIAEVDDIWQPVTGTERKFEVDTLLIAVGLSPVDELYGKAKKYGLPVWAAGDAEEISEASAAIFSGRISGRKMLVHLEYDTGIPEEWHGTSEVLRSKPGARIEFKVPEKRDEVYPVIRCTEEIPCDPCVEACSVNAIVIPGGDILGQPEFTGECVGCNSCVVACPGLAIVLVDERADPSQETALLTVPWEMSDETVKPGDEVQTVGFEAPPVGKGIVKELKRSSTDPGRRLLLLEVPYEERHEVAGFRIQPDIPSVAPEEIPLDDNIIVCRCERVTKREIVEQIRLGVRDMNQLKATLRTGMGACGGKTCTELIMRFFKEEGIDPGDVTPFVPRPFVAEVPLRSFAGEKKAREAGL